MKQIVLSVLSSLMMATIGAAIAIGVWERFIDEDPAFEMPKEIAVTKLTLEDWKGRPRLVLETDDGFGRAQFYDHKGEPKATYSESAVLASMLAATNTKGVPKVMMSGDKSVLTVSDDEDRPIFFLTGRGVNGVELHLSTYLDGERVENTVINPRKVESDAVVAKMVSVQDALALANDPEKSGVFLMNLEGKGHIMIHDESGEVIWHRP